MDIGHRETDKLLAEMEKKVSRVYREAVADTEEKLADYMRRFEIKDETWRAMVASGEKTAKEYQQWRTGQLAIGKRWEDMRDTLAADYHNANLIARSIVTGYMPEAYAINMNYATYQIEHGLGIDTGFTLYDAQTVERILRDDPQLLPAPGKRMTARIAAGKDIAWQEGQIQSVMMQGIIQGESIPNITKRIARTIGETNHASTIRYARTATTSAENAGRVDSYKRARDMGVDMMQTWMATLDNRTRHSHRMLDGESVPVGETFSNGCEYPGDPDGPPEEVWNCRCSLVATLKGYERDFSDTSIRRDERLESMTYDEWKEAREESQPITRQEEIGEAMRRSWIGFYRRSRR